MEEEIKKSIFCVHFDDGTTVRVWCKKDEAHLQALEICAEYNRYYEEHYVVVKIVEET